MSEYLRRRMRRYRRDGDLLGVPKGGEDGGPDSCLECGAEAEDVAYVARTY